ncbi:MAG: hypothetical protein IPL79_06470 [Myxococcales bacterium]|nr:hypothetical protein [Myxococcales bacterium]
MAEPILPSARRLLSGQFDAATIERGAVHVAAGRVVMVKPLPWPVVARISDGRGLVVTVNYDAGGRYFRGQCMCETGEDCEHVAAVALTALSMEQAQREATQAHATQAVAAAWLAEVGQLALANVAEPSTLITGLTEPALAPRMVAYVLSRRDGEFSLAFMQCQPLRKGGLGPAAPLLRQGGASPDLPAWVSDEEASRIAVLRAVARAVPHAQAVRIDRIGPEQWQQLCAARQLFWQTTQSPPLTYGGAQRETLRWVPIDAGATLHRLGLAGERAAWLIVPTRDGHYLDIQAHVLGPLDLGVSGAVVQRLIAGPPVPTAMLATAMHSVRALVPADAAGGASLPAPAMRARMVAELNKPHASPGVRNAKKYGGGNATIDLRGEAIYGDDVVALAQWDAAGQITRDMAHEGRLLQQLTAWQMRLPHRGVPSSSLDLLADARFVVDVVVPALRDAGWECVLAENFPFEAPLVEVQWHQALRPIGEGHGLVCA